MIVTQRLPGRLRGFLRVLATQPAIRFLLTLARRISADDVPGLAAEIAYRFLFALFPFLIFLAALVGFVGVWLGQENLFASIIGLVGALLPSEIEVLVNDGRLEKVRGEQQAAEGADGQLPV